MYGYRVGMVVQDYVKSSSVSITSISNSSGTTPTGFTTTVVSSKTYDSSSATESGVLKKRFIMNIELQLILVLLVNLNQSIIKYIHLMILYTTLVQIHLFQVMLTLIYQKVQYIKH